MTRPEPEPTLLDEAARAGWLYYVGGLTQDQIAGELGVSRQRAQCLVSRAMAEGLIQVRLNHRIDACLELEAALTDRFHLTRSRVAPGLGPGVDPARAIAPAAAVELERVLRLPKPKVSPLAPAARCGQWPSSSPFRTRFRTASSRFSATSRRTGRRRCMT